MLFWGSVCSSIPLTPCKGFILESTWTIRAGAKALLGAFWELVAAEVISSNTQISLGLSFK